MQVKFSNIKYLCYQHLLQAGDVPSSNACSPLVLVLQRIRINSDNSLINSVIVNMASSKRSRAWKTFVLEKVDGRQKAVCKNVEQSLLTLEEQEIYLSKRHKTS